MQRESALSRRFIDRPPSFNVAYSLPALHYSSRSRTRGRERWKLDYRKRHVIKKKHIFILFSTYF